MSNVPHESKTVERHSQIRGLKTSWLEAGEVGRPVVFLCHGFPDDPHAWHEQWDVLASRFHVIAPFVRGCVSSESAEDIKRYGTSAIVLDHLEILKQCGVADTTPITCVGHDLGAAHAWTLAGCLGPRLAGLVLINGLDVSTFARRLKNPDQLRRSWYMGLMQLPLVPEALVTLAPNSCAWLAGEMGGLSLELRDAKGFERRTLGALNQYRAMARECGDVLRTPPTSRLKSPVLALWGRDDGILKPPSKNEMEAIALHVTIRILPGGHWLHKEQPKVVNPLLISFLETCVSPNEDVIHESNTKLGVTH